MSDHKNTQCTTISKAQNVDEIANFWDTHSLADYWDQTHTADFEIRAQRRLRVTIDPDVYAQIEEKAHIRGLLLETLVNLWLKERLQVG